MSKENRSETFFEPLVQRVAAVLVVSFLAFRQEKVEEEQEVDHRDEVEELVETGFPQVMAAAGAKGHEDTPAGNKQQRR